MITVTKQAIYDVFKHYVLLSNVEQHCVAVTTLAMYLAQKIKEQKQPELDLNIVFATSLFHDLAKISQVVVLEPQKYGFTPLTKEETQTWQILRQVSQQIENLYQDINQFLPDVQKHIHETDITAVLINAIFPELLPYINQIGGTRNEIYFSAGTEIKIMHYADWRLQTTNLVDFETRINYLFDVYWKDLPNDKRQERKTKELALESELFQDLSINKAIDVHELNTLKHELFEGKYDYFSIGKINQLD